MLVGLVARPHEERNHTPMGHKITVERGTAYAIGVEYQVDGVAASLVGATLRFTVKSVEYDTSTTDSTAVLLKNVSSHVDAAAGISLIQLNPADTATLTPGDYFWDIKVQHSSTLIYTLDKGRFALEASPTNRVA